MLLRLATQAMGTRFELVLEGSDEREARAAGEAALEVVERCDARYSAFRTDSLISRINRQAATRALQLDEETFELLSACQSQCAATDGAFDVAIGPLMRAWGFHPRRDDLDGAGERGTFELDRATRALRFTQRNTAIDLGAVAKGHALDLAAAKLRECGVERALLHGGTSSVIALGAPPEQDAWRVQLAGDGRPLVRLRDAALGVSAPSGRTIEFGGHAIGHVLDPTSGRPVAIDAFAAVVAPSACRADVWSTAALVLLARGADPLRRLPGDVALFAQIHGAEPLTLGPGDLFEFPLARPQPTP